MIKFLLPVLVSASTALLPGAPDPSLNADRIAAEAETAIERAYLHADAPALAEAVKPLDAALAAEPNQPSLLYTRAFARYATGGLGNRSGSATDRETCFAAAVGLLERVDGAPWAAEAAALRGTIQGMRISLQKDPAAAGATLGSESIRQLTEAGDAAPASPRVLMFLGRSRLFTPREYGGDPAEGAALLQRAADRFAAGSPAGVGPRWGHAETLAWLGYARQQAGDLTAARAAWQQALGVEPGYAWVKSVLLPSLDRKPDGR